MLKSNLKYCLLVLFAFLSYANLSAQAIEDESELIKKAGKLFNKGEYVQALDMYRQLVSVHPQNPEYNFKYGTCLIYGSEDKQEALKYLNFAVKTKSEDPNLYFFLGRALQLNYQFDKAVIQYKKYKLLGNEKEVKAKGVDALIDQCNAAKDLLEDIQQINVAHQKKISAEEFFRAYRLGSMQRKIIVKPDDFKSKLDKKNKEQTLIVHSPNLDTVYFSSYGKDGKAGKDIFRVIRFPDGTFSEPDNLGPLVNSDMDEDYPYLHPSGKTLYFASKGHNSIGGYDLYKSEFDESMGMWGKAQSLGMSINSPADDILYVCDASESVAYFSSNRANKDGEMTVYKIFPNQEVLPYTIVRGEIVNENSRQNNAKVTVEDAATGEVIGVFNSQSRSGAFTMTLQSNNEYNILVQAPGADALKVKMNVPPKTTSKVLAKKFILKKTTPIALVMEDDADALKNSKVKNELLLASTQLEVNQEKDIEFNSVEKKPSTKPTEAASTTEQDKIASSENADDEIQPLTEEALINEAKQDLAKIEKDIEKTQKQADAAYFVANKKNVKSQFIKEEIAELSRAYAIAPTPELKQEKKEKIEDKQSELKQNTKEAVASLDYARKKESQVEKQKKQKQVAQSYLEALETAKKSGNSPKAIQQLEQKRAELDQLEKELIGMETQGDERKQAELATKKLELEAARTKVSSIEKDIADVKNEQKNLLSQAESTKNKGLKEELKLQANELDTDLKKMNVDLNLAESTLKEKETEFDILNGEQSVLAEIENEAEDENFVAAISDDQKKNISSEAFEQEKVASTKVVLKDEKGQSVEDVKQEIAQLDKQAEVTEVQKYKDELKKAELEKENLEMVREEKAILLSTLEGDLTSVERGEIEGKIEELNQKEDQLLVSVKKYASKAKEAEKEVPINKRKEIMENNASVAELEKDIKNIEAKKEQELKKVEQLASNSSQKPDEKKVAEPAVETEDLSKSDQKKISDEEKAEEEVVALNKEIEKVEETKNLKQEVVDAKISSNPELKNDKEVKKQQEKVEETWAKVDKKKEELEKENNPKKKRALVAEINELQTNAINQQDALAQVVEEKAQEIETKKLESNKAEEVVVNNEKKNDETPIAQQEEITDNSNQKQEEKITELKEEKPEAKDNIKEEESKDVELKEEVVASAEESISNDQNEVSDEPEFNPENPSKESLKYSAEGYGVQRKEVTYSPSANTNKSKEKAGNAEKEAAKLYYEAQSLLKEAESNPKKAKKLKKQAEKLLEKGQDQQEIANEAYAEMNRSEFSYNVGEVKFILENNEVENSDSAVKVLQKSKELYAEALKVRMAAKKEKDFAKKTELINKAYDLEVQSLELQNAIITGEIDEGIDEKLIDEVESEYIVQSNVDPNDPYVKKAEELRQQAEEEEDPSKKMMLAKEARITELAANKKRTQGLIDDLKEEEVKKNNFNELTLLAKEQAGNNVKADEAYQLEKESDLLYEEANSELKAIENEADEVEKLKKIPDVRQKLATAKEKKQQSLALYQKSKEEGDTEGYVPEFKQDSEVLAAMEAKKKEMDQQFNDQVQQAQNEKKEETTVAEVQEDEPKNDVVAANDVNESTVSEVEEQAVSNELSEEEVNQDVDQVIEENVAVENTNSKAVEEVVQNNIEEDKNQETLKEEDIASETSQQENTIQDENDNNNEQVVQTINELPAAQSDNTSVQSSYTQLIAEANAIEKKEAERLEKIQNLRTQSREAKSKSEENLKEVDNLSDASEIQKRLQEAERYRVQGEELEAEANTQEEYMKNSIAEAKAKRMEADLVIEGLPLEEQQQIIANANGDNSSINSINKYLGEPEVEEKVASTSTPSNSNSITSNDKKEELAVNQVQTPEAEQLQSTQDETPERTNTDVPPVRGSSSVDLSTASALGKGSAEDQMISEDFDLASSQTYSSNNPIPVDAPLPKGLVYKVQVGAFKNEIDPSIFKGISPLHGERTSSGIVRYTAGMFRGFKSANMAKGRIRNLGFTDAFVVVFYDGKRITMEQADQVINQTDENEKFVYENIVEDEVAKLKSFGITEEEAYSTPKPSNESLVVQNPSALENGLENDITKINGTFYTVQIGVFTTPKTSSELRGVTPLNTEKTPSGYLRYTTGVYFKFNDADLRKESVREQGISDAFVTAYSNGKRVSVAEANTINGTSGESSDQNASANSGSDKQDGSSIETAEVVFKVQVGAYRKPVSVETTPVLKDFQSYGVDYYTNSSGLLIYTVGSLKSKKEADSLRQSIVNSGLNDAFVVAFRNGKRISMQEALR